MRTFKNSWFTRFAAKEGITDGELKAIVNDVLETGQAEANLGGGVYKVRVARPGEGKSGGHRVIVFFKSEFRTFSVYGFEKSDRANIGQREKRDFKKNAKDDFALTDEQIEAWLRRESLVEVF
ncbi:MAG: type II toxin-antitoxin system RelE/ParE family toxin [Spirochaetaceae bacterium]|nr:type II toxin-antitoxin system RelE/ParE family toxin [Spirochaetaceae bacterium]